MKRWLYLLAVLLCIGCWKHIPASYHYVQTGGYSPIALREYKVWIDYEFGEADKVAIDNAIKQWNYALNGYVVITVESYRFNMEPEILKRVENGEGWVFLKINSDNPMVKTVDRPAKPGEPRYWTLAWVNQIGGSRMWMIRNRLSNEAVEGVTMHEIGHLLGASHDDVYLMRPHYNWEDYRCVDYAALKRVADYQHLPMGRLNFCEYEGANLPVGNRP